MFQKEQEGRHSVCACFVLAVCQANQQVNCMGAVVWPRDSLQHELSYVPPPGFEKMFLFCF